MIRSRMSTVVLALLVLAVLPGRAHAQIGGLIRKKVGEAVKGPEKKDEAKKPEGQASPFPNVDILEITEPRLDDFERGLRVEISLRAEFRAVLAKYPTEEQYRACQSQVGLSDEAQKLMSSVNMPDSVSPEKAQKAMERAIAQLDTLMRKKCPLRPDEWTNGMKADRLDSIRAKAAEAAGPDSRPTSGPDESSVETAGPSAGGQELVPSAFTSVPKGISVRQYDILIERIQRYCEYLKSSAAKDAGSSGGVRLAGTGINIFWVFTPTEVKTLSAANCQRMMDLITQII